MSLQCSHDVRWPSARIRAVERSVVASVLTVNGVATFNNLSIQKAGIGYTTASNGVVSSALSSAFNITPAAATHLTFAIQPTNAIAVVINPSVSVQVRSIREYCRGLILW